MNRCLADSPQPPAPGASCAQPLSARRPHSVHHSFRNLLSATLLSATLPLAGLTGLMAWSTAAVAQEATRTFPPKAERGAMQVTQPPDLLINGRAERLSPGARIRGVDNLLLLSGQLVGQTYLVNFVRESHGLVHEVWVLTPAEAAQPIPPQP